MQKLIMPFRSNQMLLCGYKHPKYKQIWNFSHYGIDISAHYGKGDTTIIASGEGKVVACGYDNSGGNVIVVQYFEAYNENTGKYADVIARYMHLSKISVTTGQTVKHGDTLGLEGNTKTTDYHLHLEFDSDTKYPCYSPQVSSADDKKTAAQGNILRKGTDSSLNPVYLLHITGGQTIVPTSYANSTLVSEADKNYKIIATTAALSDTAGYKVLYEKALAEMQAEKNKYDALVSGIKELI